MKTRFTWSTDQEALDMLAELAKADNRKSSAYLTLLVKQEYAVFKRQQAKESVR